MRPERLKRGGPTPYTKGMTTHVHGNRFSNLQGPWADPEVLARFILQYGGSEKKIAIDDLTRITPALRSRAVHGMLASMLNGYLALRLPAGAVLPLQKAASLHTVWSKGEYVAAEETNEVLSLVQEELRDEYGTAPQPKTMEQNDMLAYAAAAATSLQPRYYPEAARALAGYDAPIKDAADAMSGHLFQAIHHGGFLHPLQPQASQVIDLTQWRKGR